MAQIEGGPHPRATRLYTRKLDHSQRSDRSPPVKETDEAL